MNPGIDTQMPVMFVVVGILIATAAVFIILTIVWRLITITSRGDRRQYRSSDDGSPDPLTNPANPLSPLYMADLAPGAPAPGAGDTTTHHGSHSNPTIDSGTWSVGGGFDSGASNGGFDGGSSGSIDSGGGGHSHH